MSLADRCDEVTRLIDDALKDVLAPDAGEPGPPFRRPARSTASRLRPAGGGVTGDRR